MGTHMCTVTLVCMMRKDTPTGICQQSPFPKMISLPTPLSTPPHHILLCCHHCHHLWILRHRRHHRHRSSRLREKGSDLLSSVWLVRHKRRRYTSITQGTHVLTPASTPALTHTCACTRMRACTCHGWRGVQDSTRVTRGAAGKVLQKTRAGKIGHSTWSGRGDC